MALHGDIKVNGQIIAVWMATREEEIAQDGPNVYEVSYYYTDLDKKSYVNTSKLEHVYDDGAPALVAKVMAWVTEDLEKQRGERQPR